MSTVLQSRLRNVTESFVAQVLDAVRTASLSELYEGIGATAPARPALVARPRAAAAPVAAAAVAVRPAGGRRLVTRRSGASARRSSDEVTKLREKVVGVIQGSTGGIAISEVARKLGLTPGDITRPLALALRANSIKKTGEKRMTRYFPKR
jgi:hypothetical protein